MAVPQGVAQGEDRLSRGNLVGISKGQDRQVASVDFDQGQVAVAIDGQDALRAVGLSIGKANGEVAMFSNDVKVRGDDPVPANDESRPSTALPDNPIDAFDDHHGRLDQLGELLEILRITLGQFQFGEGGRILVLSERQAQGEKAERAKPAKRRKEEGTTMNAR